MSRFPLVGTILLIPCLFVLCGCQTWTSGMTLPSGRYLEHPPQYFPPSPPFPLPRELATQEAVAAQSQTVTLTVVNVRQEPVLLFTIDAQGEMKLAQQVAHGEAVDLSTTVGQRWVAIFSSAPHQTSHVVKADPGVWLLRQPLTPQRPTTNIP